MLLQNRELRNEALLLGIAAAVCSAVGFCFGTVCGCMVIVACLILSAIHFLSSRQRYQKIRKLSEDLECLLVSGTPLPIERYQEGDFSILGNQLQKMTLQLTEAADRLQAEKRYLADSLADISHQLRTPLTAMNLTAAMLSSPALTDERRQELLFELRRLLDRTDWLVETLLKLSKLDAGTVTLNPESRPVRAFIDKAAEPLRIPMELREQHLELFCDGGLCADLTWTAEAIGNILKNCVEHTPEGGRITIRARETPLFTEIIVEDTGPGLDAGEISHLFERFYRGKNTAQDGYGIGLALARTIICAQNGTVQAMNGPAGARFTIKFYKQVI